MTGQPQPRLARHVEGIGEIAGLARHLVARKAEPGDEIASSLGRAARNRLGAVRAEMANGRDAGAQGDAMRGLGPVRRLPDSVQILPPRPKIATPAEIGRDEALGIHHALRRAFLQHRRGQAGVILGACQHGSRRLVDTEEMVEIAIGIAAIGVKNPAQIDRFLLRHGPDEIGRGRALQMQVQFDLGCHRKLRPGPSAVTPRCAATLAATSAKAHWPICPL